MLTQAPRRNDIHRPQTCQNFQPVFKFIKWAVWPFYASSQFIGIDSYNKNVSVILGIF